MLVVKSFLNNIEFYSFSKLKNFFLCSNAKLTKKIIEIEKNEDTTTEARDMVDMTNRLLAIVVGLLGAVAQGVLAGCHRGSWNEYLTIASDVALAAAMVAVLLAGWGILGLAAATLGVRAVSESIRIVLAVRACEGLSVRLADASWPWVQRIFTYGTKTSAGILQER